MDPDWFARAVPLIRGETAAVCGMRRERFPDRNLFHTLTDLEWRFETGPCRYFGGDVLITREALVATGGFDEGLVAGEDPELSYRVRHRGWRILRIDAPMTTHDINMSTVAQYTRRAHRSGYAYAEIALRFMGRRERLWLREFLRITARSLAPVLLVLMGVFGRWRPVWFSAAAYVLVRPLTRSRPSGNARRRLEDLPGVCLSCLPGGLPPVRGDPQVLLGRNQRPQTQEQGHPARDDARPRGQDETLEENRIHTDEIERVPVRERPSITLAGEHGTQNDR